jgi:hypothetical protein
VTTREKIVVGGRVPADVELESVPADWGPSLTKYRYVYSGDRVMLVEPGSRTVYVPWHSRLRGLVSLTSGIVLSAFFDPPAQRSLRGLRAPASCSMYGVWDRDVGTCGELWSVRTSPVVRRRKLWAGRRECFERTCAS